MKKFFILATCLVASFQIFAADKPTAAPPAPTQDVATVKAIYCNAYTENNYNFDVTPATGWEELTLGTTKVRYTENFSTCTLTNSSQTSYDCSGYPKFHFDVWAPEAGKFYLKFVGANWEYDLDLVVDAGWRSWDVELVWWTDPNRGGDYDFKDLKEIVFSKYTVDGSVVTDKSLAFANLYFFKEPEVTIEYPSVSPAVPGIPEDKVYALFSATYPNRTYNFKCEMGSTFTEYTYTNGQKIFYTENMGWAGFANWGATSYDLGLYDAFHVDIWVTVDSKIKVTFEGVGFKDGALFDLKANQWNSLKVDLLNAPYQTYDFKTVKVLILEGFTNEGTPMGVANAYFGYVQNIVNAIENVSVEGQSAVKRLINGQIVIEKDGKRYNLLGAEL